MTEHEQRRLVRQRSGWFSSCGPWASDPLRLLASGSHPPPPKCDNRGRCPWRDGVSPPSETVG